MGVEEGVPVAVRVGRDVWRSLRGLSQACRAAGSVARGSRRARSRLRCGRGAREAELSGRDWWAALDGQARNQSRLSESNRSGAGERERERTAAARSKAVAATWLDRSRRGVEDAVGDAVAAAEAAVEAAEPPEAKSTGKGHQKRGKECC